MSSEDTTIIKRFNRRNKFRKFALKFFNSLTRIIFSNRGGKKIGEPKKILLANYGHIGDMVISIPLINEFKKKYPQVKIGILVGSWNKPFLEGLKAVDYGHILDHWLISRRKGNFFEKMKTFSNQRRIVINEIRQINYDIAFDLRAWVPNAIPELFSAKIPIRVGYDRAGFAGLLTHPKTFVYQRHHELRIQFELINSIFDLDFPVLSDSPYLPEMPHLFSSEIQPLLGEEAKSKKYRILHTCSGNPRREWSISKWRALLKDLTSSGHFLIFTGYGDRESKIINSIMEGSNHCINACGKLSLNGFIELIRHAELVYTVDSAAGHIAAAVGTPSVVIFSGTCDKKQWAPLSEKSRVVSYRVPCFPCFQKEGCMEMLCLEGIDVRLVKDAGESLLSNSNNKRWASKK